MKINSKATSFAKSWANHLLRLGSMQHSTNSGFGENLYYSTSSRPFRNSPRDCESIKIKMLIKKKRIQFTLKL